MTLASIEVLFNIPIATFTIYMISRAPLNPYISWATEHYEFSHVQEVPAILWRNEHYTAMEAELSRWVVVSCAFVFFAFFGFADEAKKNYRSAFQTVAKRVRFSTGSTTFGSGIHSSDYGSEGCVHHAVIYGQVFPIANVFFFLLISE